LVNWQIQRATIADQAVIKSDGFANGDTLDVETQYVDHEEVALDVSEVNVAKERERTQEWIKKSKTVEELEKCLPAISDDDFDLIVEYDDKKRALISKAK